MICSPKITCLCIMLTLVSRVRITAEEARRRAALPPGTSITGGDTGKSSRSEGDQSGSMLFAYAPPPTTDSATSDGNAEKGDARVMVGGKLRDARLAGGVTRRGTSQPPQEAISVQSRDDDYDFAPAQVESQARPISIGYTKGTESSGSVA